MDIPEQIATTASAFDTLADSINEPTDQLTNAFIPTFKQFNIDLASAPQYIDEFSYVINNSKN